MRKYMVEYKYRQIVLIKSGGGNGSDEAAATGGNANGANSRTVYRTVEDEGVMKLWLPGKGAFLLKF